MIEVKNVTKCFDGFKALDGLNLTVPTGAIYGLVGPNGSGKSTIIRHIMGIYRQDAGEVLVDGTDVAIIANGLLVAEALEAAKVLAEAGISARVINMATIKPLDEELVLKAAQDCGKIITCEEHSIIGGLGEAVCGLLSEKCPTPVRRIGVNDEFGHSGPAGALLKQFGLCADHIVEVAKEFVGK